MAPGRSGFSAELRASYTSRYGDHGKIKPTDFRLDPILEIFDDWFERERLHFAAQYGDIEKMRGLLSAGHDVNAFDDLGMTPLHYAAAAENPVAVMLLLQHGANANARCETMIGDTPLAAIASTCTLQMATLLMEAGADPCIRGWMHLNALDRAKRRIGGDGPKVHELLSGAGMSAAADKIGRRPHGKRRP